MGLWAFGYTTYYMNTPMMMMVNLEKTLIAKEEKSYENSLSEAKDTVSRWYDDTASGVTENTGSPVELARANSSLKSSFFI